MKPLKPSMRENKRYLLVSGKNPRKNVEKAILDFIGVLGLSKCSLSFVMCDRNSTIICVNREMIDKVRASLCVYPEKMEVLKVSGTLKGLGK